MVREMYVYVYAPDQGTKLQVASVYAPDQGTKLQVASGGLSL